MKIRNFLILFMVMICLCGCSHQEDDGSTSLPTSAIERTEGTTVSAEEPMVNEIAAVTSNVPVFGVESDGNILVAQEELGKISASYYRLPQRPSRWYSADTYMVCTDEVEMNRGNHYAVCLIENGEITQLENIPFSQTFELFGSEVRVELEYAVRDGKVFLTYIPAYGVGYFADSHIVGYSVPAYFDTVLPNGTQVQYPLVVDLEKGVITDILSGYALETVEQIFASGINRVALREDGNLIIQNNDGDFYYFNTADGTVYSFNEMTKSMITDCSLLDDAIICWHSAGTCFRIDLADMSVERILVSVDVEFTSGIRYGNGCSFVLYNSKHDGLRIYDFLTGEDFTCETPEGFSVNADYRSVSPDGRKFLTYQIEDGVYQPLIFDCDAKQFISVQRNNPNGMSERSIYFTPTGEIVIIADETWDSYIYKIN